MIRLFILGLSVISLTSVAFADNYSCYGTQANKGSKMSLSVDPETQEYSLSANLIENGKTIGRVTCEGQKDSSYKPRTANPKYDRYTATDIQSESCNADYFWISKSISGSAKGFAMLDFPSSGPHDYGTRYGFLCVAQ